MPESIRMPPPFPTVEQAEPALMSDEEMEENYLVRLHARWGVEKEKNLSHAELFLTEYLLDAYTAGQITMGDFERIKDRLARLM